MNMPPPQCPPPETDCTSSPSSTTQEFSYPYQRHVVEAPIGSMIASFSTAGSGRRHTLSSASANTLTRTSLYLYAVPGALRGRDSHSCGLSLGRSAQSGLPQSVPSQSLVWRSKWFHVIWRLCGVSNKYRSSRLPCSWIGGT